MIIELIDEAVKNGARRDKATALLGLSARAVARWRSEEGTDDRRRGPSTSARHQLTQAERIVGCSLRHEESAEHARDLVEQAIDAEGADGRKLVLHSDNGGPMKGSTLLATCAVLVSSLPVAVAARSLSRAT